LLPGVNYLVSIAVSWLTGDETVPDTATGKPVTVTISNSTIKAGASAYAIVNNVSTLLGTAAQDGSITVSLTSDPEIVVAATKPEVVTNVSATPNGKQ
jgi:Flp pilus assembly protein TadG